MVNDTYDLIVESPRNRDEKLAMIRVPLVQSKSKTGREEFALVDWLVGYGLVLMSDRTYYYLGIV